jgi:hypothetical protein
MPSQHESSAVATAAVSRSSNKLRQLLFKRLRQLLRVIIVLAVGLAVAASGLAIWLMRSLNGLPDIGEPFDIAALRAFTISEDKDAFVFFGRANERRGRSPLSPQKEASAATVAWSDADPELRAWVEANGPALELFLRGAECPDGISRRPGEPYSGRYSDDLGPRYLVLLALLEGGRRMERRDMAGAWDCYRAVLRTIVLSERRGSISERFFAGKHHAWLRARLQTWAADDRTTADQLRTALIEAMKTQPRPEWHAFSLKVEYLDWMRQLETMQHPDFYAFQEDGRYRLADLEMPEDLAVVLYRARRFLLREPERSRRSIRLLFANWLAHADGAQWSRHKPDVIAKLHGASMTARLELYPVAPEASAGARARSPHELATWLVTAYDLKAIAWSRIWPSVLRSEQVGYRELLVVLASELYRRDHGALPPSEQTLVGTYLESLPDDGTPDPSENNASIVE